MQLEMLLAGLVQIHPVCIDLPAGEPSPELLVLLATHRVGSCWHIAPNGAPAPGGEMMVALSAGGTTLELRQTLEALARWQEQGGRAALFFEGPGAAEASRSARTLVELMGI